MMTDLNWNEFCELYYDVAMEYAEIHLKCLRKRNGEYDRHVDLIYVRDAAVLSALEKVYAHFDSNRGANITTYLSTIVHNEIVDGIAKEAKRAAVQTNIDDLKTAVHAYADDDSPEARERLIPRLRTAIAKLSPSDQVILNYYLENKSSYIARSSVALNVSENYVSVRRNRIFSLLPRLMEMTRNEYLKYCYESNDNALASSMNKSIVIKHLDLHNPIVPALDIDRMVEMLIMAL
jgi:DNA-directed RNA polymerase specialized sigma24 family protein